VNAVLRLLAFILISITVWTVGAAFVLATMLPCGLGPDAACDDPRDITVWLAVIGVLLVYAAICIFLRGRWIQK
jgi:hypothetical protein